MFASMDSNAPSRSWADQCPHEMSNHPPYRHCHGRREEMAGRGPPTMLLTLPSASSTGRTISRARRPITAKSLGLSPRKNSTASSLPPSKRSSRK